MNNNRAFCFRASSPILFAQYTNIQISVELTKYQEKLNEAVSMMNKNLQEVNIQNMNVELVAQMFKNYQSNVLFHLEGTIDLSGLPHWPVVLTET